MPTLRCPSVTLWSGVLALALGGAAGVASADDNRSEAASSKTWKLLESEKSWILAYTVSSSPGPVDQWNRMSGSFVTEGSRLLFNGEHPQHGPVTHEVTVTDKGYNWVSAIDGQIVMLYDPADAEHPFKGKGSGYTYMLIRRH